MPRVSVIIPHYNDLAGLGRCLSSIDAQTMMRDDFEVIVADNASPLPRKNLETCIAGRARLIVVNEKGAGPARNGGVAASQGDTLAFIDADCVATPGWLDAGVSGLASYDFIGGHVAVLVEHAGPMTGAEAFEAVFAFNFRSYILDKGFTGSGNMFVSRAVFDRVGGFRTGVSEDKEWSLRARSMGFRLGYVPAAAIAHPARRDWAELRGKWRRLMSEMYLLARERPGGRLRWLVGTWALPPSAVAHTPRVLTSDALPDATSRWRALVMLYRLRWWRFVEGHRLLLGTAR